MSVSVLIYLDSKSTSEHVRSRRIDGKNSTRNPNQDTFQTSKTEEIYHMYYKLDHGSGIKSKMMV